MNYSDVIPFSKYNDQVEVILLYKSIDLRKYKQTIAAVIVLVALLVSAVCTLPVYADDGDVPRDTSIGVTTGGDDGGDETDTIDISAADVSNVNAKYLYTGSAIEPDPVVTVNGEKLTRDTDYSVSYSNNTAVGTATLTIEGINSYSGTITRSFEIYNVLKQGWQYENNGWYYYKNGVPAKSEWVQDNTGWCWLDENGRMATNSWVQYKNHWYYLKSDGYMAANRWINDNKGWCWLESDGQLATNKWLKSGGYWYYLKADGYMAANQWIHDGHGWCWIEKTGKMSSGKWIKSSGVWYYLQTNGYMATNKWIKDSHGWCRVDNGGRMLTASWFKNAGKWYYLKADGYMAYNQWIKTSGGWCWLTSNGEMAADKWIKANSNWYYLNSNGYMRTAPYVFISISEQTLYYYKDGVCHLKTPVVTGKIYGVKYHGTPTGNYKVLSKERNTHLRGLEDDGKTKYDSFVSYWMPFRGDGYGMHDASWRGSFGGTIYRYSGSHGCVNMPVSAAGKLYNMISVGTMVHIQQ